MNPNSEPPEQSDLQQLRESESRFRHLFTSAAAGIGIAQLDGRYIQANAAYCAMIGYEEKELLGMSFFSVIHPDDRPRCESLVQQMQAGEIDSFVIEKRYIKKFGEVVWVWTNVSLVAGSSDEPPYLIAVITDITQQKEVEEKLRQSETLLRIVRRLVGLNGWAVELSSRRVTWSDGVCALFEVPPGTSPALDETLDFYPPEWRQMLVRMLEQCLQNGAPFDLEAEIITTTGRRRWVRLTGEIDIDADGTVTRLHGVFQDIDEKKQDEARLRELATRLTNTLESITDAFFTLDHEWRFTYINGETERLLLRTREELLGRGIWNEFSPAINSIFYNEYHRAVRENTTVAFEGYYPPLDKWFDVRAFPSKDGLSVYFQDVTNVRAEREALRTSEERFRIVARATNDAIFDRDMVNNRIWWNEGIETLFGYSRAEMEADPEAWFKHIHPDDRERVLRSKGSAMEQ